VQVFKKNFKLTNRPNGKFIQPSDIRKLEKILLAFIEQLDIVVPMSDTDSFDVRKVLQKINLDDVLKQEFESSFGFNPGIMALALSDISLNQKIEEINFYTLKKISIVKESFTAF